MNVEELNTDILIVGGGAAGLMAAIRAREQAPNVRVTVLEKANVQRSGCLAMGLNAINLYLGDVSPESYVDYVSRDNSGVVRRDLLLSIAERADAMTRKLESFGVPFPKDESGRYVKRSARSIVMHGERLKPILAEQAGAMGVEILHHTPVYDLLLGEDGGVNGALGFSLHSDSVLRVAARRTIIATGGASGLYQPSSPGSARNKTWYCPFNAGGGLAMGIRAGAEMTSFEMRFVALRTKDVIAPTGTLAFTSHVRQRNAREEEYLRLRREQVGRRLTTAERLHATAEEDRMGNGPCRLDLSELTEEEYDDLIRSYLQMAPSIVLLLYEHPESPMRRVEVVGSEPYVNGGHGMAGFWIDAKRRTTLPRLYAAGDVAGGAPKKYLSGCFAEAEIAALDAIESLGETKRCETVTPTRSPDDFGHEDCSVTPAEVEERLQKVMDEYAGGASAFYECSEGRLLQARTLLRELRLHSGRMGVDDRCDLMDARDALDRITVASSLVEHLLARKETRWPCYQSRADFPVRNDIEYRCFINSAIEDDAVRCFRRGLEPPHERSELRDHDHHRQE